MSNICLILCAWIQLDEAIDLSSFQSRSLSWFYLKLLPYSDSLDSLTRSEDSHKRLAGNYIMYPKQELPIGESQEAIY